jgi:hypothetical protein
MANTEDKATADQPPFKRRLLYKLHDPFKIGDYIQLVDPPGSKDPFYWRINHIEDHGPDGPTHGEATCSGESASRLEVERGHLTAGCDVWVVWSDRHKPA